MPRVSKVDSSIEWWREKERAKFRRNKNGNREKSPRFFPRLLLGGNYSPTLDHWEGFQNFSKREKGKNARSWGSEEAEEEGDLSSSATCCKKRIALN